MLGQRIMTHNLDIEKAQKRHKILILKGTSKTQHGKSRSPNREFLTTLVVKMTVGELAER